MHAVRAIHPTRGSAPPRRVASVGALACLVALPLLAACGQTGPLYLPEDEGATVITRPGPTAAPVPAPAVPGAPAQTESTSSTMPSTPKPDAAHADDASTDAGVDSQRGESQPARR